MMQHLNPLQAVYVAATGKRGLHSEQSFTFNFCYPSAQYSRLRSLRFETGVDWQPDSGSLLVSTALDGLTFRCLDRISSFLPRLNAELRPYLRTVDSEGLQVAMLVHDETLFAPMYQFKIVCNDIETQELQEVFDYLLLDRAAFALWLTRTIFKHISVFGEVPDALNRARLLSREYGIFTINAKKDTGLPGVPDGFFENLYGRGFKQLQ